MWELFEGKALFHPVATHYGEISLFSKAIIACASLFAVAALIMTAVSLLSMIMTGAPFIATPKSLIRKILSLADIHPGEVVYDLGCGDGRLLIEAYKSYGATAIGIEISHIVFLLAKLTVWLNRSKVSLHRANFNKFDFSNADVIFCYLVTDQMEILEKRFRKLKRGCRILSRRFEIPGWEPLHHVSIKRPLGSESIFIYEV